MPHIQKTILEGPLKQQKHVDFVDRMYSLFGYDTHPGYAIVAIERILGAGGFRPPNNIVINDIIEQEDFEHTIFHESSHFLHPYARKFWHVPPRSEANERIQSLAELIAHLGTIIYVRELQGTVGIKRYGVEHENTSEFLAARDLLDRPELLRELSAMSPEDANVVLAKYTQHRVTED